MQHFLLLNCQKQRREHQIPSLPTEYLQKPPTDSPSKQRVRSAQALVRLKFGNAQKSKGNRHRPAPQLRCLQKHLHRTKKRSAEAKNTKKPCKNQKNMFFLTKNKKSKKKT